MVLLSDDVLVDRSMQVPAAVSGHLHPPIGPGGEKWTPALVEERLIEAAKVAGTMVRTSKLSIGSPWPSTVRDAPKSWADALGQAEAMREEVWRSWASSRPQYDSATISRAEEALAWAGRYLREQPGAARVLMAVVTAKAARKPLTKVFGPRRIPMSTVKLKRKRAAELICRGLSADHVPVRCAEIGID